MRLNTPRTVSLFLALSACVAIVACADSDGEDAPSEMDLMSNIPGAGSTSDTLPSVEATPSSTNGEQEATGEPNEFAGLECSDLELGGSAGAIQSEYVLSEPEWTGGTILDGVYDLVGYRVLVTAVPESWNAADYQQTLRISQAGTNFENVGWASTSYLWRSNALLSVSDSGSGTAFLTTTCPPHNEGDSYRARFNATASEFVLFNQDESIELVFVPRQN